MTIPSRLRALVTLGNEWLDPIEFVVDTLAPPAPIPD